MLLFITHASANESEKSAVQQCRLLILGDSISAGYGVPAEDAYVQLLAARTSPTGSFACVVRNASISGETTQGGLVRLPSLLATFKPTIVVIELGGNDGLQGKPVAHIQANVQRLVDLAQTSGARVLLMEIWLPPNYGPVYGSAFQRMYRDVAEAKNVVLVPFFLAEVALREGMMQDDGIHPTAAAQPLMLDALWRYLEPLLPAASVAK